ncbi:alpha/beta hydrolase [Amycolatopsis sacchari]|uniref:alpha/beta hydrolase n=1 Tax=Amycolatopsis sacchari TaxID=115433 RepID=UPI003D760574
MARPPRRLRGRARHGGTGAAGGRGGLPPAYIEVGQLDLFRDEDTAYATKLSRAGVPVEFHLHPGAPHEFDSIAFTADVSRRAVADRVRVLRSI